MSAKIEVGIIDHQQESSSIEARLASLGCKTILIRPNGALVESLGAHDPHVIVVHAGSAMAPALQSVRRLGNDGATARTPVLLVTPATKGSPTGEAVAAGASSVLAGKFPDIEVYTRLRALARLKVMRAELERRETILQRYGLSAGLVGSDPVEGTSVSVMAIGSFGENTERLKSAVGADALTFAANPQAGVEALYGGTFDAAILATAPPGEDWLRVCGSIRGNPRLANLPILLIAGEATFDDPADVYERGATDLLITPFETGELAGRLDMLVRHRRFSEQLREAYRHSLHLETGDALTGLYSFGYLNDYLTSLLHDAGRWHKNLTVTVVDVIGMHAINQRYGYAGGDRLLRQVGCLMGNLVRGEDLTARCGGDKFCIVTPETPLDAAGVALRRVTGVIEQTEFGLNAAAAPISVQLAVGSVEFEPGDSSESLIARARAAAVA